MVSKIVDEDLITAGLKMNSVLKAGFKNWQNAYNCYIKYSKTNIKMLAENANLNYYV